VHQNREMNSLKNSKVEGGSPSASWASVQISSTHWKLCDATQ